MTVNICKHCRLVTKSQNSGGFRSVFFLGFFFRVVRYSLFDIRVGLSFYRRDGANMAKLMEDTLEARKMSKRQTRIEIHPRGLAFSQTLLLFYFEAATAYPEFRSPKVFVRLLNSMKRRNGIAFRIGNPSNHHKNSRRNKLGSPKSFRAYLTLSSNLYFRLVSPVVATMRDTMNTTPVPRATKKNENRDFLPRNTERSSESSLYCRKR